MTSAEIAALGLPLVNHSCICILLILNTAGVLELSQLGGSLLEHLLLNDSALLAITFVDLPQDVSLVILLYDGIAHSPLLSLSVSASNFFLNELLFVLKTQFLFLGLHMLSSDSLSSILIHLLHKVDTGLILFAPFILLNFPLLLRIEPSEIINELILSLLVFSFLHVELLKINDFLATSSAFLVLKTFDFLFTADCGVEHILVSFFLRAKLIFFQ